MYAIPKLNKWANAHTNLGFDILRVLLGVFLFYKGVDFIAHTELLIRVLDPVDTYGWTMIIVHYISMVHLVGGLFIVLGLLTRPAILLQLPILISAVFLNFFGEMVVLNLLQALIAFVISVFFLMYGSGKHSVDYNMKLGV